VILHIFDFILTKVTTAGSSLSMVDFLKLKKPFN